MSRELQAPTPVVKALTIIPTIGKGGTGQTTEAAAAAAIGALSIDALGAPNGAAQADQDGYIPYAQLPTSAVSGPTIDGPTDIFIGQSVQFTITNYDVNTTYTVGVNAGTIARVGDKLNFTAPATIQNVTLTVNGRPCVFQVRGPGPLQPSVTSPVNAATGVSQTVTLTSSAFAVSGGSATHMYSDWQLASDPVFTSVLAQSGNDSVNKTTWPVANLLAGTVYFARVRHKGSDGVASSWSPVTMFTTGAAFVFSPVIAASTLNYNMKAAAIAAGWDQIKPLKMTVTVNNGVVIGSSAVANASFDTGITFPSGSDLSLVNNGIIAGKGGNGGNGGGPQSATMNGTVGTPGGPALRAQYILSVTNTNGTIGGGGGGGGGAGCHDTGNGLSGGNSGGGGQGSIGGDAGVYGSSFGGAHGAYGTAGTITAPGNGYGGGGVPTFGDGGPGGGGGNGGTLGVNGANGSAARSYGSSVGGTGGPAVIGNSNVLWVVPGTRLGALT